MTRLVYLFKVYVVYGHSFGEFNSSHEIEESKQIVNANPNSKLKSCELVLIAILIKISHRREFSQGI